MTQDRLQGASPDGAGLSPSGPSPSVSSAAAASIPRAGDSPDRPRSGKYLDRQNKPCQVIVRKETTPAGEGSVSVFYEDGSYTSAFFSTFRIWGYRYVGEW